jgi:hypothetical protein
MQSEFQLLKENDNFINITPRSNKVACKDIRIPNFMISLADFKQQKQKIIKTKQKNRAAAMNTSKISLAH